MERVEHGLTLATHFSNYNIRQLFTTQTTVDTTQFGEDPLAKGTDTSWSIIFTAARYCVNSSSWNNIMIALPGRRRLFLGL